MKKLLLCLLLPGISLFADPYPKYISTEPSDRSLPPAMYNHEDDPVFFLTGEFTYLRAVQEGMALAIDGVYTTPAATKAKGSVIYPKWPIEPGLNVAIGGFLPKDGIELKIELDYFSSWRPSTKTSTFSASNSQSTWTGNTLTKQSSNWKNRMFRGDFTLGHTYFIGHYLSLKPYAGIMGIYNEQVLTIDEFPAVLTNGRYITSTVKRSGGGTLVATDINFYMYNSVSTLFSLSIDGGIGLLFSEVTATNLIKDGGTTSLVREYYTNRLNSTTPMLESTIGLRWEAFVEDQHHFNFVLLLGWEQQTWLGFNRMSSVAVDQSIGGAYTLSGFILSARAGF